MSVTSPPASAASATHDKGGMTGDEVDVGGLRSRWRRPYVPPPPIGVARQVAGTTVIILASCLLGFGGWLGFLSGLQYDRAQHVAYADFRAALIEATAPTGPTDPANPGKLLASGTPVALLAIPAIGMNAVVFQGTSPAVMENGPGHLRDSVMPGQSGTCVIMGRLTAYGGPFGKLGTLSPGDAITVTTGQGISRYTVLDLRRAGDATPAPLQGAQGRLTLITADGYPFAPTGVLRVDATLTSTPFAAPTMVLGEANLSPGEDVLGTDTLAWVPIVLWGQALLIAATAAGWLWRRWGTWQTWIAALPVLAYLGINVANEVARLLPNLM